MRRTFALLWLAVIGSTELRCVAQAAGHNGCCTAFSKTRAVNSILKSGEAVMKCRQQGITEGCSINAVVLLTWKRRQVCVNPTPRKMRNLLAVLCNRKACKGDKCRRLRRKTTKT
ncbi:hypothetical protein PAMA_008371 [Pampus argenteus]